MIYVHRLEQLNIEPINRLDLGAGVALIKDRLTGACYLIAGSFACGIPPGVIKGGGIDRSALVELIDALRAAVEKDLHRRIANN